MHPIAFVPVLVRHILSRPALVVQEVTAKDYAEKLLQLEDLPELKDVKALHKALKKAEEPWIASFRDSDGMVGIYKVCVCEGGGGCFRVSYCCAPSRLLHLSTSMSVSLPIESVRAIGERN